MKIKVSKAEGVVLDYLVATCEGYTDLHIIAGRMPHETQLGMYPPNREYGVMDLWELGFTSSWSQGGPIIEKAGIEIYPMRNKLAPGWEEGLWCASLLYENQRHGEIDYGGIEQAEYFDRNPLLAAMRCYVASKLGEEVEVPEELL